MLEPIAIVLGAIGSALGIWNFFSNARTRTIVTQAEPLIELRTYLENALPECEGMRSKLQFDRYDLANKPPMIGHTPQAIRDTISALPGLSRQIVSPSEARIMEIHRILKETDYFWSGLHARLVEVQHHQNFAEVLEWRDKLHSYTDTAAQVLREYIKATANISKGNLITRWRYSDHLSMQILRLGR